MLMGISWHGNQTNYTAHPSHLFPDVSHPSKVVFYVTSLG